MSIREQTDVVYTPEEVAKVLKVAGGTVRNLIKKGRLFAIRVGDQYRVPRYAFEQLVAPFAGVDWDSIGFGIWKDEKGTKDPVRYVQRLRRTRYRSVKAYLEALDAEAPV
ncbi:MAG: helix-turn-helix domain-containing protein [Deltaproteobacteria bacterium]|nr:helix-turn-helix domain-containing protein [Deltaproteobacteria bacterium]